VALAAPRSGDGRCSRGRRPGGRASPGDGKTVTRTLSTAQAERYRPLFDNAKRLKQLVAEIEDISARAVEEAEGWAQPEPSVSVSDANTPL
jgi:hypothetical protein